MIVRNKNEIPLKNHSVPVRYPFTSLSAGVALWLGCGQAGLERGPPKLQSVPDVAWHCDQNALHSSKRTLEVAKRTLGSAQRAWPFFGLTLACAQTGLIDHISRHKYNLTSTRTIHMKPNVSIIYFIIKNNLSIFGLI